MSAIQRLLDLLKCLCCGDDTIEVNGRTVGILLHRGCPLLVSVKWGFTVTDLQSLPLHEHYIHSKMTYVKQIECTYGLHLCKFEQFVKKKG